VTQGAVFKHFATKDSIWAAAMRWVREELLGRIERAVAEAQSSSAALSAIFAAHVDFIVEFPGVPRVIFHELQQPADSAAKAEVRQLLQSYRRLLLQALERAAAVGEVAPDLDHEAAATAFVGLIQGLVMQGMLAGRPASLRSQGERLFALYLRGIGVER
jgi:AcrR family transcriptional regulator